MTAVSWRIVSENDCRVLLCEIIAMFVPVVRIVVARVRSHCICLMKFRYECVVF